MVSEDKMEGYRPRDTVRVSLSGWNVWSRRFIDPPTWTWEPVPGAASFEVMVAAGDQQATSYQVREPSFDMSAIWAALPHGPLDMLILGHDSRGKEVCVSLYKSFFKVHDFDGHGQEPLDWSEALRRNAAYLLAPARDHVEDFEEGLPRGCWMSMEDSVTGQRWSNWSMPGLYHSSHIFAFLTFADSFPDDPLASEAERQARAYGDWLLENRMPSDFAYADFPYSNVGNGRLMESSRGTTVTRAGRVGIAMLDLYRRFLDPVYLDYAKVLADGLAKFQRGDGSWPYRVNPRDGAVISDYTSDAVTPARLFALLEEMAPNETYRRARQNADRWMLQGPMRSNRWEGMYEDAEAEDPFINLQNLDANEMVRYLVHFRDESPEYLEAAERLNRWIEDQFVVWQPEDCAAGGLGDIGSSVGPKNLRCPTPTVLEQYLCDFPMEGHTGNWLLSLLALHIGTGKEEYLLKGTAAANSIVRGQQESGAFSTWGFDTRFGRPLVTLNWPGDNSCGHVGLSLWREYREALETGRPFNLGLWGL